MVKRVLFYLTTVCFLCAWGSDTRFKTPSTGILKDTPSAGVMGGSAGPINPLTFASKLQFWFDAQDASTISIGTGVSQWRDKSGKGNHLSQGTGGAQPVYASTVTLAGKMAVVFDGSDDELGNTSLNITSGCPTMSLYHVAAKAFSGSNRDGFILEDAADADTLRMRWVSGSNVSMQTTTTDASITSTRSEGTSGEWVVRKLTYDGAAQRWYYGGGVDTDAQTGAIRTITAPAKMDLGNGDGAQWQGGVAEVAYFCPQLSTSEETAIDNYFRAKYPTATQP